MDRKTESETQEIEASGDAIIIAGAINNLAESIRELAKTQMPEDSLLEPESFMDGTPK